MKPRCVTQEAGGDLHQTDSSQSPRADSVLPAFDQGYEVTCLARKLFHGGIEIGQGVDDGLGHALALSQEAIKARKPVFEAAFESRGGLPEQISWSRWTAMPGTCSR
jgi:hypothetical protein